MNIWDLNEEYQEILKLDAMLTEAGIPHETTRLIDGWQVSYPHKRPYIDGRDCIADAVEHQLSFGHENDRVELMGLPIKEDAADEVYPNLTAEEAFERIKAHYMQNAETYTVED